VRNLTAVPEEGPNIRAEAGQAGEQVPDQSHRDIESLDWQDLYNKVNQLYLLMEKLNLTEYITYLNNPLRLLWRNFGAGLAKGLGGAIGATLLLGLVVMFLKRLVLLNLPVIGGVIGEIVKMVNVHNGNY